MVSVIIENPVDPVYCALADKSHRNIGNGPLVNLPLVNLPHTAISPSDNFNYQDKRVALTDDVNPDETQILVIRVDRSYESLPLYTPIGIFDNRSLAQTAVKIHLQVDLPLHWSISPDTQLEEAWHEGQISFTLIPLVKNVVEMVYGGNI